MLKPRDVILNYISGGDLDIWCDLDTQVRGHPSGAVVISGDALGMLLGKLEHDINFRDIVAGSF